VKKLAKKANSAVYGAIFSSFCLIPAFWPALFWNSSQPNPSFKVVYLIKHAGRGLVHPSTTIQDRLWLRNPS
jgi:hypothetical protein